MRVRPDKRTTIKHLIVDVERHLEKNGPWKYKLSKIYFEPEVTTALDSIAAATPVQQPA
jgi:hypothetical protein